MKKILLLLAFLGTLLFAYDPYAPQLPSTNPWATTDVGYEQNTYETEQEQFYSESLEPNEGMYDHRTQDYDYSYELAPIY